MIKCGCAHTSCRLSCEIRPPVCDCPTRSGIVKNHLVSRQDPPSLLIRLLRVANVTVCGKSVLQDYGQVTVSSATEWDDISCDTIEIPCKECRCLSSVHTNRKNWSYWVGRWLTVSQQSPWEMQHSLVFPNACMPSFSFLSFWPCLFLLSCSSKLWLQLSDFLHLKEVLGKGLLPLSVFWQEWQSLTDCFLSLERSKTLSATGDKLAEGPWDSDTFVCNCAGWSVCL